MENNFTIGASNDLYVECKKIIISDVLTIILEDGTVLKFDVFVDTKQFKNLPPKYHWLAFTTIWGMFGKRLLDFSPKKEEKQKEVKKPWWRIW
jgi:predicted RNA-binding protein